MLMCMGQIWWPSVVGLWHGWTQKKRLTSPTWACAKHLRLTCMTSLSVNKKEEIWQLDHWVDESLPWRSHSKGCGQWFNVQVENSGEWRLSGAAIGTRAVQHLCQWQAQWEKVNFWVCNDKPLLCIRQGGGLSPPEAMGLALRPSKGKSCEMVFFVMALSSLTQLNCKTPLPSPQRRSWRFLSLLLGHDWLHYTDMQCSCHVLEGVQTHQRLSKHPQTHSWGLPPEAPGHSHQA